MNLSRLNKVKINGWKLSTVGTAAEICNNFRFPINEEVRGGMTGEYPYYGPTGVLAHINEYRVEGEFTLIGEDGDHFLKFRDKAMTLLVSGKFNVNNHAHLLRGGAGCITKWLFYFYMHADLSPLLTRQGVGRFKLTKEALSKLPLLLPPLPEQRKIADILTTWDDALEKLDALISAKERRKKALMQQLLTRTFAREKATHDRHRLGDVCERVTRRNSSGDSNVLTISAQSGLVSQRDYFNRNVSGADLTNYYLLHLGEFAYNRSSSNGYPFGALKRLDAYETGVVSTLYLCFRIKDLKKVSSNYLCQYFEIGLLNAGLRTIAKEGARAHGLLNVTSDEFFDLDIFLPSLSKQSQIATILDACDEELRLLHSQRTAIDQQKRGLMQKLLTGKVRVGDEEGKKTQTNNDRHGRLG